MFLFHSLPFFIQCRSFFIIIWFDPITLCLIEIRFCCLIDIRFYSLILSILLAWYEVLRISKKNIGLALDFIKNNLDLLFYKGLKIEGL